MVCIRNDINQTYASYPTEDGEPRARKDDQQNSRGRAFWVHKCRQVGVVTVTVQLHSTFS